MHLHAYTYEPPTLKKATDGKLSVIHATHVAHLVNIDCEELLIRNKDSCHACTSKCPVVVPAYKSSLPYMSRIPCFKPDPISQQSHGHCRMPVAAEQLFFADQDCSVLEQLIANGRFVSLSFIMLTGSANPKADWPQIACKACLQSQSVISTTVNRVCRFHLDKSADACRQANLLPARFLQAIASALVKGI